MRQRQTQIYKKLQEYANKDLISRDLISLVDKIFEESRQIHKTVLRHMPEYTLHDEEHLIRILEIMDRFIPTSTLQNLTPLELAGLILSAALHDIGMAPSEKEIRILLSKPSNATDKDLNSSHYISFRESYSAIIKRQNELRSENRFFEAQELEAYLLSEYLRQTHGDRGRQYIFDHYYGELFYANFNFANRIAEVCFSHTDDPISLEQLPCWELVRAPGEYVNWRFIAIMLRVADILDFDGKRTPVILFEHLGIREKVSLKEWKKHISIQAWDIRPGRIAFSAKCPDPIIEKCVRDFIQIIEKELFSARSILNYMHDPLCEDMLKRYFIEFPPDVDVRNVGPEKGLDGPIYKYVDLRFQLDAEGIISLVMGINLYGNRLLFLRELLQNAVDTCRYRQALHKATSNTSKYIPNISVEIYEEKSKWFLAVEDNGMGMDENIVREYFTKIAKSYYRSGKFFQERAESGIDFQPISAFGIGVMSVFMVTDQLIVETRKLKNNLYDLDSPIHIEIDGPIGLFWFRNSERKEPGTRLVLCLKEEPSFLKSASKSISEVVITDGKKKNPSLKNTIKQLAPHIEIPISVHEKGKKNIVRKEWRLPEHEVSDLNCREIVIDLTSKAPTGLDGIIKVLLLQDDQKRLSSSVELEEESFYCHSLDEELHDRLEQRIGHIEHIYIDYSEKDDREQEGYSTSYSSMGRWSQQGFRIESPLFGEYYDGYKVPSSIHYPFVVYYDLDLSADFVINLTVDRMRFVLDEKFENVKRRICEVISTLLLEELGKKEVMNSQEFFQNVLEGIRDKVVKNTLEVCLERMLRE